MANKRHIIHAHIERVTGTTQSDINAQLKDFFINVPQDNVLYDDQDELNKGILVVNNDVEDPSIYIKDNDGNIVKISGNGSKDVNTYEDALSEATSKNMGQIFYVKEETVLEDGTIYSVGPYIVVGEGEMMKLAASSPSGDVEADVMKLKTDVSELNRVVRENEEEVINSFNELNSKIVSNETSINLINTKLDGVEEGAQVNVIEKILVNGTEMPITNKTLSLMIDFPEIESEVDGRIENAYIDEIDGKKYLVLTFTESANAEDILVDVSEMFTEQYTSGKGISLTNSVIALKLGANEKILGFDENGGLIFTEDFNGRISDLEKDITGIKSDVRDVVDTVIKHTTSIETLSGITNTHIEEISDLTKTVNEQGEDIDDIKNELSDLSNSVTLKDNLTKQEISDINAKFDEYTLLTDFAQLEYAVSGHSETIDILSGITDTHTEKISGLTDTVNAHDTRFLEINEDVERIGEVVIELSGGVGTILSDFEKVVIINVDNYVAATQKATKENIGQIIRISKDSEVEGVNHLKGYYFVEGEGELSFIMTSDGKQDEIAVINECLEVIQTKLNTIDEYTVNGQAISQENGVLLEGDDIQIGESIPESQYVMDVVMSNDTVNSAIKKVENSLAATVIAMTASLNDMNSQINWVVDETQPTDGILNLKPNTLHVIEESVSAITLNGDEEYGYAVLMKTSDAIENIVLPQNIVLTNLTISELEPNANYLLELKYNFARWTKLKTL